MADHTFGATIEHSDTPNLTKPTKHHTVADHTFGVTIDSLTLGNDEETPEFVEHCAKKISMQVQNPEPLHCAP